MYVVGLVWHGDRIARETAKVETSRFAGAAEAISALGMRPVPVVYHDDAAEEARNEMLRLDAVQVWVNPIEGGRDRSRLDQVLRDVAGAGVLVSTHPDTIMKMGTKRVLFDTRHLEWGSDVELYGSPAEMAERLPHKLRQGPRVLKRMRGHSGGGIWKVERFDDSQVKVRHAQRGSREEVIPLPALLERMQPYFDASSEMIDQAYQARLPEGMIRVYMVEERVGGFGHQAINALYPAAAGAGPDEMPQPGPRLYYPPDQPEFQRLARLMESRWVPDLRGALGMTRADLPLLWDADFLLGPTDAAGKDSYVLCEINVSSVSPYPEWVNPLLAETLLLKIAAKESS